MKDYNNLEALISVMAPSSTYLTDENFLAMRFEAPYILVKTA